MPRTRRNIQHAPRVIIGREKLHFERSRQTASKNIGSTGNASIDITSLRKFDEKGFYTRMKDNLFTKNEISIIDGLTKKIPFTTDFQLLKNITSTFVDIESKTILGLNEKPKHPGKLFVLRKIQEEVPIKPYEICLYPLHLILNGIQNQDLKHNFLCCAQHVIGKHIYLSEFTEGGTDYDMMTDHWSEDERWHDDADIPDEETEEQGGGYNEHSIEYLQSEYGEGSECYKLFAKLKRKGFHQKTKSYFKRKKSFKNKADNICFDLCLQMLSLRKQKLELHDFDRHDFDHIEQFSNGVIFSSHMMQFSWKEDFVEQYYTEDLNSTESAMTELGIYVELTENGPAEFSPEILAYAHQLQKFFKTIDKLYNTILNGKRRTNTKK